MSSPAPGPTQSTGAPAPSAAHAHRPRRSVPVLLAVLLALTASLLAAYAFLSRPAEIVSFELSIAESQPTLRFRVANARRIELWANRRPADPSRLTFDPATGIGAYAIIPDEADFVLLAYNHLGEATAGMLAYPVPTATTRPTPTSPPAEVGLVLFAFNGVNKVNDLSDILLNKGESLLIEWEAVNADEVELLPAGTFKPRDAVRVAPGETTAYTLIARNPFGEVRRSVKVIVIDAQATAAVLATAAAVAQATRDAEAAAQAQIAAAATAASQATATAIADALARAQAAAAAKATQDALAILDATATAIARETAQAAAIAAAQATAEAQRAADAAATAVVQATAQAMAARYSQYNGVWVNDDPTTDGITRLVIGNAGPTIAVQAFSYCRPRDCDWGIRSQAFVGEPFSITFAFGDGITRRLTLTRIGDKLRVTDADSRGPVRTYTFSPAR